MMMVKLPNLEQSEVLRLIEALEHRCAELQEPEDANPYAELKAMLERRAHLDQNALP